jgi:hypothetical protein
LAPVDRRPQRMVRPHSRPSQSKICTATLPSISHTPGAGPLAPGEKNREAGEKSDQKAEPSRAMHAAPPERSGKSPTARKLRWVPPGPPSPVFARCEQGQACFDGSSMTLRRMSLRHGVSSTGDERQRRTASTRREG